MEPDAVGGRLGRQVAERDVQPLERLLAVAEPELGVGDADGQRLPLVGVALAVERVEQRRAGGGGVAGGALRLREGDLRRAVRREALRGGVEARRRGGRRALELARGLDQQGGGRGVAGLGGVLDVVSPRHHSCPLSFERRGGARVGGESPAAGRALVDGVADDRMPEREPPGPGCADERARQQVVERRQPGRGGQLGHLGGQRGIERVADDGGGVEHAPRGGVELVELGGDRQRDGLGHVPAGTCELLEVEGIAAARAVDAADVAADQLSRLSLAQRGEGEPRDALLARERGR